MTLSCQGNAMLGQGTVLLCCDSLTAQFETGPNNKYSLANAVCSGRVRSYIWTKQDSGSQEYYIWGDRADFKYSDNELFITGQPLLRQGPMEFTGSKARITLFSQEELNNKSKAGSSSELSNVKKVVMEQPRGVLAKNDNKFTAPKFSVFKKLPARCPLPVRVGDNEDWDASSDE